QRATLEDLFEPVRDINDRHARTLQAADQCKKSLRLAAPQGACRFVEHEDSRPRSQCRRDLYKLFVRDRERRERPADVDGQADRRKERLGATAKRSSIEKRAAPGK